MRKTKIIATIGPRSSDYDMLKKMVSSGMDVVRLNFSHGDPEDHQAVFERIRSIAQESGRYIGIMIDLQGPKIRIGRFESGSIELKQGQRFIIDHKRQALGDQSGVSVDYDRLHLDVKVRDFLLLNDGLISVKVVAIEGTSVITECVVGGELSSSKGINVSGGGLSASALTEKDIQDLKFGCQLGADYIALSFVKNAQDIEQARHLIHQQGSDAGVIAKIERKEALEQLDSIIESSDGVMVARGDLALEIGDAQVPVVQKQIVQKARFHMKPVIIATQMMESMIINTAPTRAETSDVANAIIDGCDAVMLSAETAIGKHPHEVINVMAKVCLTVERSIWWDRDFKDQREESVREMSHASAIAVCAAQMALLKNISAVVSVTESGTTALHISRFRVHMPIFGVCGNLQGLGKMTLYRGVRPVYFDYNQLKNHELADRVLEKLVDEQYILSKDHVIMTKGDVIGQKGATNSIKVISLDQRHAL
jgi:pyruvate kinase